MCTCITDVCHCCAGLGFESVVAICLTVLLGLLILQNTAIAIVLIVTIHKRRTTSEKNQREKSENERLTAMTFANSSNKGCAQQPCGAARYNGMSMENKIIVCCDRCKFQNPPQSNGTGDGQNGGDSGSDQCGETKPEKKKQVEGKADDPKDKNSEQSDKPDNDPSKEE